MISKKKNTVSMTSSVTILAERDIGMVSGLSDIKYVEDESFWPSIGSIKS